MERLNVVDHRRLRVEAFRLTILTLVLIEYQDLSALDLPTPRTIEIFFVSFTDQLTYPLHVHRFN